MSAILWMLVAVLVARMFLTARGGGDGELAARQSAEIARLREEVDQLNAQVLRLAEEQSFLTRLLSAGGAAPEGGGGAAPEAPTPQTDPDLERP